MAYIGIIAIRKPKGPTSHDIVDAVRRITGERRVGHAGTLDPMAEGVLVLGIGREATKQLATIVGHEKEYVAEVRLGATSDTNDAEGEVRIPNTQFPIPNDADIARALPQFIGRIMQVPPIYSALKIAGQPAHRRVRRGEDVTLAAREVEIRTIEILEYAWPSLALRVTCGPGVYIRALARDMGVVLGTGGYLTKLERTRVGDWTFDRAQTLEAFAESFRATKR